MHLPWQLFRSLLHSINRNAILSKIKCHGLFQSSWGAYGIECLLGWDLLYSFGRYVLFWLNLSFSLVRIPPIDMIFAMSRKIFCRYKANFFSCRKVFFLQPFFSAINKWLRQEKKCGEKSFFTISIENIFLWNRKHFLSVRHTTTKARLSKVRLTWARLRWTSLYCNPLGCRQDWFRSLFGGNHQLKIENFPWRSALVQLFITSSGWTIG